MIYVFRDGRPPFDRIVFLVADSEAEALAAADQNDGPATLITDDAENYLAEHFNGLCEIIKA